MKRTIVILWVLLAACGDNGKSIAEQPDASTVDAPPGASRAVVVAGDFVTPGFSGVMSSLDVTTMMMSMNVAPAGSIGNDPVLRRINNELYVVNRAGGNNVTIFDASTLQVKEQLATGAGSNPQDVATFANKLFVPAGGTAGVLVLERGTTKITTISLAALDPDGFPDCVSAIRMGNDIYVACGMLDPANNFTARGPGKVVVIDGTNNAIRTTLTLSTPNPFGVFTALPDAMGIAIPTFDFAAPMTRCLERVTVGAAPFANGCLVQHSAVGGYIVRTAVQQVGETQMLWMIVNNGNFSPALERARLWGYDLTEKTLWDTPVTPETQVLTDIAVCPNGKVVAADKTIAANGLRVYDGTSTMEITTAPLPIGLRPQSSPALVCY